MLRTDFWSSKLEIWWSKLITKDEDWMFRTGYPTSKLKIDCLNLIPELLKQRLNVPNFRWTLFEIFETDSRTAELKIGSSKLILGLQNQRLKVPNSRTTVQNCSLNFLTKDRMFKVHPWTSKLMIKHLKLILELPNLEPNVQTLSQSPTSKIKRPF